MKIKIYSIILLSFFPLFGCQPPVPGTPVWDIAAENVLRTDSIESMLENIDIDFIHSYTTLDTLLELTSIVESKAQVLLADLSQLQSQVQSDVAATQVIESKVAQIEAGEFAAWDITGVFTALDELEQDIISQIDLLNVDLAIVSDNLAQLITTDVMHNLTITSQLEQLSSDVLQLKSVLETIDVVQQLDVSNSIVDLIAEGVSIVADDLTQLQSQLAVGFQGTFSALEINAELAQDVTSLIDEIPISVVDNLPGVYDALSELEITMETISSQVDAVGADIAAINSAVDLLGSKADQISSQFDNVENSLAHVESILANLIPADKLSLVEGLMTKLKTDNSLLDYMLDASLYALSTTISSKVSVIDSEIVDQNSSLELVSNDLVSVESMIDNVITDDISRLEIINSHIDIQLEQIAAIESSVDTINQNIDYIVESTLINSVVHDMQAMSSLFDHISSELPTVSSVLEELDDQLFVIESLVDVIIPQVQTEYSYATNIESRVDLITLHDAITSISPGVEDEFESIESKLDIYASLVPVLETVAQELVDDMSSTWTVLSVIEDSLVLSANALSNATELLHNDIEKALSASGVFTVIDAIIAQEDALNTEVDTYASLIDALNTDLATDFNGIFTALDPLTQNQASNAAVTSEMISLLSSISSDLTIVQNSLGIPIYGRQLPLTITTPGRYYLAENINFLPSTGTAITINTDNVTIDLNGKTLHYAGVGSSVLGILINNVSNTRIINGTISNFSSRSIQTGTGTHSNSIVQNLVLTRGGINFVGTGRNHICNDNFLLSTSTLGLIAIQGPQTNLVIDSCVGIGNSTSGLAFGVQGGTTITNMQISNCYFQFHPASVTATNGIGFNGGLPVNALIQNNIIIPRNSMINLSSSLQNMVIKGNILTSSLSVPVGINLNNGSLLRLIILENIIMKTSFGIFNTTNYTANSTVVANFNRLINNTSANIRLSLGRATFLGNFAFNLNATGNPNNTNYNLQGSTANINGKYITVSQGGSFIGVPTYWHNINMLP